jgi:integrase
MDLIDEWIATINPAKNTERNYRLAMKVYCKFTGKTPSQLLKLAESEVRKGTLMRERSIKSFLISFRKYLIDQDFAPFTIKGYMVGVSSFYRTNDIELPNIPKMKVKSLVENQDIPTKDDLIEVLKVCDPLEKAVLLVGASSGLAANEITSLRIKDFKKGYDPVTGITTLKLRREKVQFDFITFLSPEASRAVLDYLDFRERTDKTKETKQLEKQRIFSENNFLFCARIVSESFLENKDENLRCIGHDGFMKMYRKLSAKARKNTPKGHWNLIRSHNLRKWFNSVMLNAGCDSFHVEYFIGHTLDDTRAAYFRASPEKLKEIYQKYVPYLTIQKEQDISESEDFKRIKAENATLLAEAEKHRVERSEFQEIKAEQERTQKMLLDVRSLMSEHAAEIAKDNAEKGIKDPLEHILARLKK